MRGILHEGFTFMSIMIFLTVVQALVAFGLVTIILIQRSEGGGLGGGGSPAGLMSARGAANFLTRSTAVLATAFVVLSIVLAVLAAGTTSERKIDTSLDRTAVSSAPADPLAASGAPVTPAPAASHAPANPLGAPAPK
jgi:preprotein translocase subunit SecG